MYLGNRFLLQGLEQIKINGILFRQDPEQRVRINVDKAITAMEKQLRIWSTRNLTLLGKILIIKTFAVSQIIYLLQSMSLNEAYLKLIMKSIYKYLWNRNLNAPKAPERIKRTIMLTPVSLGGFGMVDVKDLSDSLDLRSYGRLLVTEHPFFKQVRNLIDSNNYFDVGISGLVDRKLKESLKLLNVARKRILAWPVHKVTVSSSLSTIVLNTKLSKLLTGDGMRTLSYFMLSRKYPNCIVRQLTPHEFRTIERLIRYPELRTVIRSLLESPPLPNLNVNDKEVYPCRNMNVVNISSMASKALRLDKHDSAESIICLYKIGLALDPGEVKSWMNRLKRLTSTRHKNIILRLVHGDIFSNARLFKFGLKDSAACLNCPEPIETIQHRVLCCPKARKAWEHLNEAKISLGLNPLTRINVEEVVGAQDRLTKIELALNAELIVKLTSRGDGYCPKQLVRASIQLIGNSEIMSAELRDKIKNLLSSNQ